MYFNFGDFVLTWHGGTSDLQGRTPRPRPAHHTPEKVGDPIKGQTSPLRAVHDCPPDQQGPTPPNLFLSTARVHLPAVRGEGANRMEVTGWTSIGNLYQQRENSQEDAPFHP